MEESAILMRVSLIAYQLTFKRQDLIRSIGKIASSLPPLKMKARLRLGNVDPLSS